MIKIEYPTVMPLARRIRKDTKRLDSDKLIGRMKKNITCLTLSSLLLKKLLMTLLMIWTRFYSQERLFGAHSYAPSNLTA